MGNPASKLPEEVEKDGEQLDKIPHEVPTTPISTPKFKTIQEWDPRSPSSNVVRTPIQLVLANSSENTPDNACDTFNINSPVLKQDLDPRSPSMDFTRTPIVTSNDLKLPIKLHNKNLDNVRKTLLNVTPKKISDMPSYVPPKLLASSPLVLKPIENKRHSMVGVLETNLDYVETDLDTVILNNSKIKSEIETKEDIEVDTPEVEVAEIVETKLEELKIEDDTEKLAEPEVTEIKTIPMVEDDGLIVQKPENQLSEKPKIVDLTPKERNDTKHLKINEFSKKISDMIYTDEESDAPMTNRRIKDNARTPLGIRNGEVKRTVPKLKVSDKPRKIDYAVSKIPVFKDKKLGKLMKQCENTPPKDLRVVKSRQPQWDTETTLII